MEDFFDYLKWRGDLDFSASPFNEVDCLLLCQISYIDYSSLVPVEFSEKGPALSEVGQKMTALDDFERRSDLGGGINPRTMELMLAASKTERFGSLRLCAYRSRTDAEKEEQFCALTFSFPEWNAVIYRGTDSSLIGWKEDFNLGYLPHVPAQTDAAEYLDQAASRLNGPIFTGGHSKGGNLAVYAATHCREKYVKRIQAVFNNDGPGFSADFFKSERYIKIMDRIYTYVPQLSIVGMLFCHSQDYKVVRSSEKGFGQHDPMSWILNGAGFDFVEHTDRTSVFIGETLNDWIDDMTHDEREEFVEAVFTVLKNADITDFSQMSEKPIESIGRLIGASVRLSPKPRSAVFHITGELLKTAVSNLKN